MNKYQQFAVNHYLDGYMEDMTFEEVLSALYAGDMEAVTLNEIYESAVGLSFEEIADEIYQMAADLERLL